MCGWSHKAGLNLKTTTVGRNIEESLGKEEQVVYAMRRIEEYVGKRLVVMGRGGSVVRAPKVINQWSRVRIPLTQFGNFANFFTPLCQCLSEEMLKAVGPFYLVSMQGK